MNLRKLWKARNQILEGIRNDLFRSEHVELIASQRMDICNACPFIDRSGESCFVPGTQPCCSKCGCKLSWKIRALSESCGDKQNPRWEALMDEKQEDEIKKKLGLDND